MQPRGSSDPGSQPIRGDQRAFAVFWGLLTLGGSLLAFVIFLFSLQWVALGCNSGLECDGRGFSGPLEVGEKVLYMLLLIAPIAAGASLLFVAAVQSFSFARGRNPAAGVRMWRFTGLAFACAGIPLAALAVLWVILGFGALVFGW